METIKVNMTPNPLDVQTIHASQNDTEARQWGFELHNNGDVIDASEVTDQIVFKAYEGGTEQLLPENGSVPVTSPFLGDIKYPQGLLTDQEFTYRESPTESDGLAFVESIKGNTLVWNQLVQNGNFENTSLWGSARGTISASNNILSYSATELGGGYLQNRVLQTLPTYANHKYFISITIKAEKPFWLMVDAGGEFWLKEGITPNVWNVCQAIRTGVSDKPNLVFGCPSNIGDMAIGDVVQFKNVMLIDLTQMGLDSIASVEEFTSLFSLPFYAYNQGTLLSFNGNGIKTVGFNQWDEEWEVGAITAQGTPSVTADRIRSKNFIPAEPNTRYYRKTPNNLQPFFYDENQQFIEYGLWGVGNFTTPSNCAYMKFQVDPVYGLTYKNDICINISDPSKNGTYEPYTSSTLSLPISTYFPSGMKSAGSVYDELTETKAITRIGSVDLGTLTYVREAPASGHPDWPIFYANVPNALGRYGTYGNTQICAKYSNRSSNLWQDKTIGFGANSTNINIADTTFTDYTVDQVKQALSGVILYYQLATESETSFTTASLVTENAEIPLSNEDGVLIGKCTEELSAEPGFIDAKIKLTDSDGTCYSNKLQLHVERSPQ